MIVIVDSADAEETIRTLGEHGESAWHVGQIVSGDADGARTVRYV